MRKFYLVFGAIAAVAVAGAAACTVESTGSGGGGGSSTGTETGTGTGTNTGTGTGTTTGTMTGTGGGMGQCAGCADFILDDTGTVMLEDLCGFQSYNEQTGEFTCDAGSSCASLADLQNCVCVDNCSDVCEFTCTGTGMDVVDDPNANPPVVGCQGCTTNNCAAAFNTCTGDSRLP
ncbi:MAG: hypothetical protein R3B72_30455 [Polyangiaceae bacterium]